MFCFQSGCHDVSGLGCEALSHVCGRAAPAALVCDKAPGATLRSRSGGAARTMNQTRGTFFPDLRAARITASTL